MSKLTDDLKKLTNLNDNTTDQLARLTSLLVGQYVYEDNLKGNEITEVDLGVGTLYISTQNNEIKTKFVLYKEVLEDIINIKRGDVSKFETEVNNKLTYKLTNINEELI